MIVGWNKLYSCFLKLQHSVIMFNVCDITQFLRLLESPVKFLVILNSYTWFSFTSSLMINNQVGVGTILSPEGTLNDEDSIIYSERIFSKLFQKHM